MNRAASNRGLAYRVKGILMAGNVRRPHAVAVCHGCGAEKQIALFGGKNNPERIQRDFREDGWAFDAWNLSKVFCPSCLSKRAAARHGDSGAKAAPLSSTQNNGADVVKNKEPSAAAVAPPVVQPIKLELTVEERGKVRDTLALNFDDKLGQYLDGWSDARVAKDCGDLPVGLVKALREVAFGPIKSVPAIDALRAEVVAINDRLRLLGDLEVDLRNKAGQLGLDLVEVQSRLNQMAADLGVAA
ncbi:MAG: hypothetical protein IKE60_34425 [Reyranella sp.]|uniref:hypothetical protein n=1 Tax=Reyranella sp. TaxID=1929291 RepID=UPI0025EAFED8|nr:hypothetical protein [Reyranella sp.]MBR2819817.1 hypothetical protein [Reyranella sp.]